MWENIDETRKDSAHYSVMKKLKWATGMRALKEMFPDAGADETNFVLFSTSGVHGTYNTIEEAEAVIAGTAHEDGFAEVTFLIVHPRLVALRYWTCHPESMQDIEFLKALRASSHQVVARIGLGKQET